MFGEAVTISLFLKSISRLAAGSYVAVAIGANGRRRRLAFSVDDGGIAGGHATPKTEALLSRLQSAAEFGAGWQAVMQFHEATKVDLSPRVRQRLVPTRTR